MAEAEDEVTMEAPSTEYSENITEMAEFLLFLLDEREKLSAAIHQAKVSLSLAAGLDGEVSLNGKRQEIATLLRHMAGLRNGEVLISNGGVGYRFNNEGNQVSYRCDATQVTTIDFDRNKIRGMATALSKRADEISMSLDKCLVNTEVSYEPDCYIMFGKESAGIPEEILKANPDTCVRIPMIGETRSLNLSNSVAIVLYEALRQNEFDHMKLQGELHRLRWED